MLFGGVLELLLVGWATSRPITNLPMYIMDLDNSAESRKLIAAIENTETFTVESYPTDLNEIEQVKLSYLSHLMFVNI